MSKLIIQQWPQEIRLGRGQKFLDAGLAAGAPMPFSCMSGECGACKCRLVSGEVEHGPHSPDALSAQERASGMILACCSRAASAEVVLSLDQAAAQRPAPQRQVARVVGREAANHDVMRLRLAFEGKAPQFSAGQFARLEFAGLPPRSYSAANMPGEQTWEFHIRHVPGGKVSGHVFHQVQVGDELVLHGPHGSACWEQVTTAPLLLVAGGTGLAPVLSILRAALAAGQPVEALYHGVRSGADLYDHDLLVSLARDHGFRLVPVLSDPGADDKGARTGFVHQALGQDFASLQGYRIFVCGPPPMVDAVKTLALARGAAPDQVHADAFHAAESAANAYAFHAGESATSAGNATPARLWDRLRNAMKRVA